MMIIWIIAGVGPVARAASTETTAPAAGSGPATSGTSGTATSGAKSTGHSSSTHHKKKKAANVAGASSTGSIAGKKTTATSTSADQPATASAETDTAAPSAGKHKKGHSKRTTAASTSAAPHAPTSATPSGTITIDSASTPSAAPTIVTAAPGANSSTRSSVVPARSPIVITDPASALPPTHSAGPEVETGLPIARHGGSDSTDSASTHGNGGSAASTYQVASAIPLPTAITSLGSYSSRVHAKSALDNFTFTNLARHVRNIYPWRINIFTTLFWIGEGDTPVSSTTNDKSAWDSDWQFHNGGTDTPGDREGYMPAHHAARQNPFYVALPFNDLKYPDMARQWLPPGWSRPPKDGKQVSACQHRWLEIKNGQGEVCYAQWEDVGPLTYSDASYVFGGSRPTGLGNLHAGLDVSPAVAQYLNITGKNCLTRWRFVDDADVVPGRWLQYDEEALIFRAMHDLKSDPMRVQPIQRATAPIGDDEDMDSTKKRLGAAKG